MANDGGCLGFLIILVIFGIWYIIKFILAIVACLLVIPVRIIYLLYAIPYGIFTGDDISNDWTDEEFVSAMWHIFFPPDKK